MKNLPKISNGVKRILLVIFGILVIFVITLFAIRYFYPVKKIITPSEQKQEILPTPPPSRPAGAEATVPPATAEEEIFE